MQLADHASLPVLEKLRTEGPLRREFPQPQQANEDVPIGVLVRQERLPAAVGGVVSADQLELVGLQRTSARESVFPPARSVRKQIGRSTTHPDSVVDLVQADFATPDVAAAQPKVAHPRHCQLAQVAVLHSRRDQRHRDVTGGFGKQISSPATRLGRIGGAHRCTR